MSKMIKCGVLTFHRTTNFGSYLQTYGLYKKICDLGYECEIIDYRCPAIESRESLKPTRSIFNPKEIARRILIMPALNKKAENLVRFSNDNMKLSEKYLPNSISQAELNYDKIIVGSDIVWGLDITDNDFNYFLDFVSDSAKKYAFSSSVGNYKKSINDKKITDLLKDFSQIAVRENEAVNWVKDLSDKDADWVCDPTMLLTKEEWLSVLPIKKIQEKYVLVYFNDDSGKCLSDAINYAKLNNCKVKMINYGFPISGITNVKPNSLNEFLSLINNSQMVFTASYHGMLFSIYFEKDFYFYTRAHSTRVLSLAERLGLQERCGSNIDKFIATSIDYSKVNPLVEDFRNESIKVLTKMLEK